MSLLDKYEVYWFVTEENSIYLNYLDKNKVSVIFPNFKNAFLRTLFLLKILLKYRIKVIVTAFSFDRFIASFAGKLCGAKTIWVECWISLKGRHARLKRLYYIFFLDYLVAISKFVQKSLEANCIPSERISLIYYPVLKNFMFVRNVEINRKLRRGLNIIDKNIVIGMVAAFRKEKNISDLIVVFSKVSKLYPNVTLLLVGGSGIKGNDELSNIIGLVKKLNLEDRVVFTGYRTDLDDLYNVIDIFAFTSLNEPLGNVIVEAMQKAIPIVAYNSGGYPEMIRNCENGFLVEVGDIDSFVQKLSDLIENPDLRSRIGLSARATILKSRNLDDDYFISEFKKVIDHLLIRKVLTK
jgi:glycosyltransferase involved in cell wall biosynthesis